MYHLDDIKWSECVTRMIRIYHFDDLNILGGLNVLLEWFECHLDDLNILGDLNVSLRWFDCHLDDIRWSDCVTRMIRTYHSDDLNILGDLNVSLRWFECIT